MPVQGYLTTIIILTLALLASACAPHPPHPHAPDGWKKQSELVDISELEDKPDQAVLQVLIMSGPFNCSHTALRLYCPDKGALFWDPAGGYGRDEQHVVIPRRYDIFVGDHAASLEDYLEFREIIPTSSTEIFQWSPGEQTVCDYYDLLANEGRTPRDDSFFKTSSFGIYCNLSVSGFLKDHARGFSGVKKSFFPHDLSVELYRLNPEKVYIVKKGKIYKLSLPKKSRYKHD